MTGVLLVDDERDFADLLAERLKARGLDARAVYGGKEALEALRREDAEVVILDVGMPGMDGLTVMQKARAMRPMAEFLLLTADSNLDTAVAGMRLGARDYLRKPADLDDLIRAVEAAGRRRRDRLSRLRMADTAKLAALGELAKGVAHEINNPLNIMINEAGWIEDLLEEKEFEGSPHKAEMVRAVSRIHAQAERCKAITSKLLTLRRAPEVHGQGTPPAALAQVLEQRRARAEAQGVALVAEIPADFPTLPYPAADLELVLGHLLDNALDAMEQGGRLRLALRREEDGGAVIEVEDTGPGVDPALQQRIFEPFFSTKEVGKGTGLGLAICWSLVEAMGGRISLYSEKGRGARFRVRLPLTDKKTEGTNG
jgi:signal transduction histidine kinase